ELPIGEDNAELKVYKLGFSLQFESGCVVGLRFVESKQYDSPFAVAAPHVDIMVKAPAVLNGANPVTCDAALFEMLDLFYRFAALAPTPMASNATAGRAAPNKSPVQPTNAGLIAVKAPNAVPVSKAAYAPTPIFGQYRAEVLCPNCLRSSYFSPQFAMNCG